MHTRVQFASARIAAEFSCGPTRSLATTRAHITTIDTSEITTPYTVVSGRCPSYRKYSRANRARIVAGRGTPRLLSCNQRRFLGLAEARELADADAQRERPHKSAFQYGFLLVRLRSSSGARRVAHRKQGKDAG